MQHAKASPWARFVGSLIGEHSPQQGNRIQWKQLCPHLAWALPLAVYSYTLAPVAMWGDSAKYVLHSFDFSIRIDAGYHPLYSVIAWAWSGLCPWEQVAPWMNFLSALMSAAVSGLLYQFLVSERVRPWVALCVTLAFAFSHVNWHISVIAESYALSALGVLSVLWLTRSCFRAPTGEDPVAPLSPLRLFLLAFVCGLVISNYLLMIAYTGVVGMALVTAVVRRSPQQPWGRSFAASVTLLLGVFLGMFLVWGPIALAVSSGEMTWSRALELALNSRYASTFFWEEPLLALRGLTLLGGLTFYEYPSPLLLFAVPGLWALWCRSRLWFLTVVAIGAGTYLFCCTYMIQRAVFVLLPCFLIWAYLGALGAEVVLARRKRWGLAVAACAVAPLIVYPLVVGTMDRMGWQPVPGRDLAYRDSTRYFLLPSKRNDRGPEQFCREAFDTVPQGGCLVADFTPHTVLRYYQERLGVGQEVQLRFAEGITEEELPKLLEKYVDAGPGLYLADNEAGAYPVNLPAAYRLETAGSFYRVVKN